MGLHHTIGGKAVDVHRRLAMVLILANLLGILGVVGSRLIAERPPGQAPDKILCPTPTPAQLLAEPALFHPGLAKAASDYPEDWEQRAHPDIRPFITWQRVVGFHAIIGGYSDEAPNPSYPNPKYIIRLRCWDGTDLFELGVPRIYNGKPVEIIVTGPIELFGGLAP